MKGCIGNPMAILILPVVGITRECICQRSRQSAFLIEESAEKDELLSRSGLLTDDHLNESLPCILIFRAETGIIIKVTAHEVAEMAIRGQVTVMRVVMNLIIAAVSQGV